MWKMVTAKVTAISDLRSPTNIGEYADLWAGNRNGELLGTLPAPSDQHLATTTQLTLTKGVPYPWSQTLQTTFDAVKLMLKGHCIEFKYYADGIHSGLTPPFNNSRPAGITKAELSPSLFTPLSQHYRRVYSHHTKFYTVPL